MADVFDALTSVRPYKRAWTVDEAIAHLQSQAGGHFDPELVASFISIRAEIEDIRSQYAD